MAKKPRIKVLGGGGTIAGIGASATSAAYEAGKLGAAELVAAVPGLDALADIETETVFSTGSENLGPTQWLKMASRIQDAAGRAEIDGIVVTHGTDTLEEAAFFLDLVCRTEKPVVMTGAMRAATALGADGPANLHQAMIAATSYESRGRGVLVVMNGLVLPGGQLVKTNSASLDSFRAYPGGPAGRIAGERLLFFETARPTPLASAFHARVGKAADLPRVPIIHLEAGCDDTPVRVWEQAKCPGMVMVGFGAGTLPDAVGEAVKGLAAEGCIVVVSSRVGEVAVHPETMTFHGAGGLVPSGYLNPQKSAVLLSLALAAGLRLAEIEQLFDRFSGRTTGPSPGDCNG